MILKLFEDSKMELRLHFFYPFVSIPLLEEVTKNFDIY